MKNLLLLALGLLVWPEAPAHAGETFLHFESEAGDYIGQGQKVTLTLNETDFLVQRNGNGISFSINNFTRPMPPELSWWYADFAAPYDAVLTVGPYDYATRFPFQQPGAPGLSFHGSGRGCNTLTGRFDVREAAYEPVTGALLRFAVDFEQHCEGLSPALVGALRFNSDVPLRRRADVLMDFGSGVGLWGRYDAFVGQLHPVSPEEMATGDVDGNGQDDAILDFPGFGVWVWLNNRSWTQLHPLNVSAMATGDIDGNGRADVILVFPGFGAYAWLNHASWIHLHGLTPTKIATGDLDGYGEADVLFDFPGYGVWAWVNNSAWIHLHGLNVSGLATGDLDGNGQEEAIVDFPGYGLWMWTNFGTWAPLHPLSPNTFATGDIDGNGLDDLIVDFPGYGLWVRLNNTSWVHTHGAQTEAFLAADIDGNGQADIVVDFGSPGLWGWMNNSSWVHLDARNPEALAAGELDYLEGFTPTLLSPVDTVIPQNRAPACPAHPTRGQGFEIRFDWTSATSPHGVVGYDLWVMRRGRRTP